MQLVLQRDERLVTLLGEGYVPQDGTSGVRADCLCVGLDRQGLYFAVPGLDKAVIRDWRFLAEDVEHQLDTFEAQHVIAVGLRVRSVSRRVPASFVGCGGGIPESLDSSLETVLRTIMFTPELTNLELRRHAFRALVLLCVFIELNPKFETQVLEFLLGEPAKSPCEPLVLDVGVLRGAGLQAHF